MAGVLRDGVHQLLRFGLGLDGLVAEHALEGDPASPIVVRLSKTIGVRRLRRRGGRR